LDNAEALLNTCKAGEHFDFIEIMACPGGCVNGGGQPYGGRTGIDERSRGLYEADRLQSIRRSQENPAVETLYRDIIGDRAHELLHVDYTKNRK
jgi:NADH-quinone oxidoreductase subunit G